MDLHWAGTKGPLSQPWNSLILAMYHDGEKIKQVLMMMMEEEEKEKEKERRKKEEETFTP